MKRHTIKRLWQSEYATLLGVLLFVAMVRFVYFWSSMPYKIFGDTPGYVNFPFEDFFQLQFSSGRTPIYPTIIEIIGWFTSETHLYTGIVAVQIIVSFLSLIFFYKALNYLIPYRFLVVFTTILYGCSPAVMGWDNAILTESFALSGCVFFIYLLFKYLHHSTKRLAVSISVFTLVLTFLRPTFLYFSVILFIFYVVRYFQKVNRRCDSYGILSSVGCLGMIVVYALIFSKAHGIVSISDAKVRQDLIVSITEGYYQDATDKTFIQSIDDKMTEANGDVWKVVFPVIDEFGNAKVAQLVSDARSENLVEYGEYLWQLVLEHYNVSYDGYHIYNHDFQSRVDFNTLVTSPFSWLKFHHVYLIAVIEFVLVMGIIIKEKRIDLIRSGFFVFTAGILVSSFIGTCAEFMRTSLMVVPFSYMALATYLAYFIHRTHQVQPISHQD